MPGNETLWQTAALCDRVLDAAGLKYCNGRGVAVCLHGYQRNTVDLDLVIRRDDSPRIREVLAAADLTWDQSAAEFRTEGYVAARFLLAEESA